jgi:RNA polymerase sigma-70 factor (ECF subfamily)
MDHSALRRDLIDLLPRLRRFASTLVASAADADDLVQIACLRAIERPDSFLPGTRLDAWVFTILRNAWRDDLRRRRVRDGQGTIDAEAASELVDANDGAAHLAEREVRDAMLGLPEGLSSVLLLVSVEGYTYAEAARILDIPAGTVTSRIARARAMLATSLGEERGGGTR